MYMWFAKLIPPKAMSFVGVQNIILKIQKWVGVCELTIYQMYHDTKMLEIMTIKHDLDFESV